MDSVMVGMVMILAMIVEMDNRWLLKMVFGLIILIDIYNCWLWYDSGSEWLFNGSNSSWLITMVTNS